jgi:hypothetical protein
MVVPHRRRRRLVVMVLLFLMWVTVVVVTMVVIQRRQVIIHQRMATLTITATKRKNTLRLEVDLGILGNSGYVKRYIYSYVPCVFC